MDGPKPAADFEIIYLTCDAINHSRAPRCWFCASRPVEGGCFKRPLASGFTPKAADRSRQAGYTSEASLGVVADVLVIVGLGCQWQSPLLGTAYFVVADPGSIVAILGSTMFRLGSAGDGSRGTLLFVILVSVTVPLAILLGALAVLFLVVSAIAAFFEACTELFGGPG